jgi:hypothetical protein
MSSRYFTNSNLFLKSLPVLAIVLQSCATSGQSTRLGGGIGAATGAIVGGLADPGKDGEYRTRNVIVGTAVGGLAGIVAGSTLHNHIDSQNKAAFDKGKQSSPSQPLSRMPTLKEPRVETKWVESRVVGNRYVEGHFEHHIVEGSRWDGVD